MIIATNHCKLPSYGILKIASPFHQLFTQLNKLWSMLTFSTDLNTNKKGCYNVY